MTRPWSLEKSTWPDSTVSVVRPLACTSTSQSVPLHHSQDRWRSQFQRCRCLLVRAQSLPAKSSSSVRAGCASHRRSWALADMRICVRSASNKAADDSSRCAHRHLHPIAAPTQQPTRVAPLLHGSRPCPARATISAATPGPQASQRTAPTRQHRTASMPLQPAVSSRNAGIAWWFLSSGFVQCPCTETHIGHITARRRPLKHQRPYPRFQTIGLALKGRRMVGCARTPVGTTLQRLRPTARTCMVSQCLADGCQGSICARRVHINAAWRPARTTKSSHARGCERHRVCAQGPCRWPRRAGCRYRSPCWQPPDGPPC